MTPRQNVVQMTLPYFCGRSPAIQKMLDQVLAVGQKHLFIYGLPGSGKRTLARALHQLSGTNGFVALDLGRYTTEDREAHIWTALQDIFRKNPDTGSPRYSTIYVQGLDVADILFLISILEWLIEQKTGSLRVIVAVESEELLRSIPPEFFAKYELLSIPELEERLLDFPAIIEAILTDLNRRQGTSLKYLENGVWDYFLGRSWSGNIDELRYNLEAVIFDLPPNRQDLRLADLIKSAD